LAAAELSTHLGLLRPSELESLREGVRLCGPLPAASDLDVQEIANAISRDKKIDGGHVQWVLLDGIGHPRIVDGKEISARLLQKSLKTVLK